LQGSWSFLDSITKQSLVTRRSGSSSFLIAGKLEFPGQHYQAELGNEEIGKLQLSDCREAGASWTALPSRAW
jgi:hypothetical protein